MRNFKYKAIETGIHGMYIIPVTLIISYFSHSDYWLVIALFFAPFTSFFLTWEPSEQEMEDAANMERRRRNDHETNRDRKKDR